jgi:hydrogenase expression/formation protein HypC
MCIGTPMQIIESGPVWALCASRTRGEPNYRRVDMRLVGAQPPGTWVLVFLGAAREVMGESQALQVLDAIEALTLARAGQNVDHLLPI